MSLLAIESNDEDDSLYSEHEKVTKLKSRNSKWPPKFLANFEASEKPRYIDAVAKLTDNYAKAFSDIKFEPDLEQPPLKFLSKNDIINIIRVDRQKINKLARNNNSISEKVNESNLGKRRAFASTPSSNPQGCAKKR